MRFLSINHLRFGQAPIAVPQHLSTDTRSFSTRAAWFRAVALAVSNQVHAVVLTGHTISPIAAELAPWGPLAEGLADIAAADIPVIGIAEGQFNPRNLSRFAPDANIHWLTSDLDWNPPFTTSKDQWDGPSVHIIPGNLAQQADTPAEHAVVLSDIDHADSIWLLTSTSQPDALYGEQALVIEPGSLTALDSTETGRHGAWLVDTDTRDAELIPLAGLEFAAIEIDVSTADNLDTLESTVTAALINAADTARADGSIATTLLVDATLTGATRLYPALLDTASELESMLVLEHHGMTIALTGISIDATPQIDLTPLLGRPDPVGELARLIDVLQSGAEPSESQSRLLADTEQKMMAVSHARVFGSILDHQPAADAPTLLLRQSWATLDALVRQRGID